MRESDSLRDTALGRGDFHWRTMYDMLLKTQETKGRREGISVLNGAERARCQHKLMQDVNSRGIQMKR